MPNWNRKSKHKDCEIFPVKKPRNVSLLPFYIWFNDNLLRFDTFNFSPAISSVISSAISPKKGRRELQTLREKVTGWKQFWSEKLINIELGIFMKPISSNNFSIEMPGVALSMISDLLVSLFSYISAFVFFLLFIVLHVKMSFKRKKGDMDDRRKLFEEKEIKKSREKFCGKPPVKKPNEQAI